MTPAKVSKVAQNYKYHKEMGEEKKGAIFVCFYFIPFLGPFLNTAVKKREKRRKKAPGFYLHLSNLSTNLTVTVWVIKIAFPKKDIFCAQNELAGPWLVRSLMRLRRW